MLSRATILVSNLMLIAHPVNSPNGIVNSNKAKSVKLNNKIPITMRTSSSKTLFIFHTELPLSPVIDLYIYRLEELYTI